MISYQFRDSESNKPAPLKSGVEFKPENNPNFQIFVIYVLFVYKWRTQNAQQNTWFKMICMHVDI